MFEHLFKAALVAKSILGLSVAYEIATAGQMISAVSIGALGVAPHLWIFTKRLVERAEELAL
jgi:hypothetical protein